MKSIYSISFKLFLPALIFMTGCEPKKDSADVSRLTYYPTFEIIGDDPFLIDVNDPPAGYTDPGVVVTEQGVEISFITSGADEVDVNTAGIYTVTYSATNKDGYDGSASRTVIVGCDGDDDVVLSVTGDAVSDLAGPYTATLTKVGYATWAIDDINYVFSIPIPGTVTILCGEVVGGTAGFGMYRDMYIDGDELVIEWAYDPLGLAGETRIPISLD